MVQSLETSQNNRMTRLNVLRIVLALGAILALYSSLTAMALWMSRGVFGVFLPAVILILGLLASSLVRSGLRGRYALPLSRSALATGVCGALLAIVIGAGSSDALRIAAFATSTAATLAVALLFFFDVQASRSWFILRAIAIFLLGLTGFLAAGLSNLGTIQSIGPIALATSAVTAVLAAIPMFAPGKSRMTRRLATISTVSSNLLSIGGIMFLVASYFLVIRPFVGSDMPQALSILEWSMVVVAFAIAGWLVYSYLKSSSTEMMLDDWPALGDEVRRNKAELAPASEAVKDFVESGRKEGLVILVASVLKTNSVDEETSKKIIAALIEYREEEPRLISARAYRMRRERLVIERRRLVQEVLDLCAMAAGSKSPSITGMADSALKFGGGREVGNQ